MKKILIYTLLIIVSAVLASLALLWVQDVSKLVYISSDKQIKILDAKYKGRQARFLRIGKSHSSCMFLDTENPLDMSYEYTKYSLLYKAFDNKIDNVLVMGAGAYSVPKALLAELPHAHVDVCDIEPALFELAKQYFRLTTGPRLNNITADCRDFLRSASKKYDFIFVDVYSSNSIPEQFTTSEFFRLAKSKLNTHGIIMMNIIGDLSKKLYPSFVFSELKTFLSVFPNSYVFGVKSGAESGRQNIIFLGHNNAVKMSLKLNPELKFVEGKLINLDSFNLDKYTIFTDNQVYKGLH